MSYFKFMNILHITHKTILRECDKKASIKRSLPKVQYRNQTVNVLNKKRP